MTQSLWVATRKGLFSLSADNGWAIGTPAFLGDPIVAVLDDARDGTVYAALNLGHFGTKLQRSTDRGKTWEECAVPSYADVSAPPRPADADPAQPAPEPPTLKMLWTIEAGGANQPGRLWAGTLAWRPVPVGRSRHDVVAGAIAVGSPGACELVRRRLRLARHSLGVGRSS